LSAGEVRLSVTGGIATIVFDRPGARNAMTWAMYRQFEDACATIAGDANLRVAVLRGAGGTFISGTDIAQFSAFEGSQAGLDYEIRIDAVMEALERLPVPTLAVVEGAAMGGGLAVAAACDLRIASPDARFGVPIARTVGNCLSIANVARLVAAFGTPRAKRLLLLADVIRADEALACGFVQEVVPSAELDSRAADLCARLLSHAPITMRSAKEAIRRLVTAALPRDEDLIAAAYGSRDFKEGISAFTAKRQPKWEGR
jgi:enoyl-CoA hydratase